MEGGGGGRGGGKVGGVGGRVTGYCLSRQSSLTPDGGRPGPASTVLGAEAVHLARIQSDLVP